MANLLWPLLGAIWGDSYALAVVAALATTGLAVLGLAVVFLFRHMIVGSIVASLVILYSIVINKRRKKATEELKKMEETGTVYLVSEREAQMLAVVTPSLHGGFRNASNGMPRDALEARAKDIAAINPWLLCSLRTNPETAKPILWVPKDPKRREAALQRRLRFCEVPEEKDLRDIDFACVARCGKACLDTHSDDDPNAEVPPVLISFIHCPAAKCWAFCVSMAHIVGDAATLYTIYNAFDLTEPRHALVKLNPERPPKWDLKGAGMHMIHKIMWFVISADNGPFQMTFGWRRGKKRPRIAVRHIHARYIDQDWIKRQKAIALASNEAKKEPRPSVISTNDVLSSWFLRECNEASGGIAVNMRERQEGIERDLAGNFLELFSYFPNEYSPVHIRRSVDTLGATTGQDQWRPGWENGRRCGVITNWTPFYTDMEMPSGSGEKYFHSMVFGADPLVTADAPGMVIMTPAIGRVGVVTFTHNEIADQSPFAEKMECAEFLQRLRD